MDRRLWDELYRLIIMLGKAHDFTRLQFSDACVALVYLWSVARDRPRCWACDPENWDGQCPWAHLPSPSRLSRRLRTVGVLELIRRGQAWLRDQFPDRALKLIDAKPLPIGGASKDRDARCGRCVRGQARGYKIHVIVDGSGGFDAWRLTPMSANEKPVAQSLFDAGLRPGAMYVAADNEHDGNETFDAAARAGAQLVVNPRRKKPAGLGHRRQSPQRLRSLAMTSNPLAAAGQPTSFGQDLLHGRGAIERFFAHLGNFGGGLSPLPNWVRRPRRVALWVAGKFMIYLARLLTQKGAKKLDLQR